jgi:hypothetical protein
MIKTHFDWLKVHHISIDIRRNVAKHNSLPRTYCRRQIFVLGFTLVLGIWWSQFILPSIRWHLFIVCNNCTVGSCVFLTEMQMQNSRTHTFILRHTSEVSHVQTDGRAVSPHNDVLQSVLSFSLSKSSHRMLVIYFCKFT